MHTKAELNNIYERVVKNIDISDDLFDTAEEEYKAIGKYIDENTPIYNTHIYPQGSFALGTVIKPINDSDDYDLDLVCEFEKQYGLSAEELKCDVVKPLLEKYRKIKGEIQEKRRCWHVEYEHVPNFHMDIIPAVRTGVYVLITDFDEDKNIYEYIGSNPAGYTAWFDSKIASRRKLLQEQYLSEHANSTNYKAEVEALKEYRFKTPLQKSIQLLKRHRDIMFGEDPDNIKPISIIITTIAAQLYNDEDNIVDTLITILSKTKSYIYDNMIDGRFVISNPTYTGVDTENFAEKWNEHPERAVAFFEWLDRAKNDLISPVLYDKDRVQMSENIKKSFGNAIGTNVYNEIAREEQAAIKDKSHKLNPLTGALTASGTIPVPPNMHYGCI